MSVRRLAEPALQPAAFAFNEANAADVEKWIRKYPKGREQSAVIPLLMLAQEQEGWVTKPAIEHVADRLGMPYIRALEVATFYTQFQLKPVGSRAHIQVCGTTPCMLRGSESLMDVCRSRIHHEQFHTNADGTLSWEEVECLGACVNAPMVMIFKDTYEDLTPERLDEIITAFAAGDGSSVPTGPQNGRVFSAPIGGPIALRDETAVLKSTRDRETAAASAASTDAPVPPSNAGRPKTDAPETNPALATPSQAKASANGEKAASVAAPKEDRAEADKAAPEVEGKPKKRSRASKPTENSPAYVAPELADKPIGAAGKQADAAAPVEIPGRPSLSHKDRPAALAKPESPDDLQLISGVGPKIEGILHGLGIFTYAQIASWTKAEREWVDGYLKFHGRIEREDWVRQADALAKGGRAEYVRVFGRDPR